MKELSIKEKAKAYDRVSKEVKDFFEGKQKMYNDVEQTLEYLFPNLKESKEEKTERILHSISSKMSLHLHDIFTEEEFQCFDTWSNVWLKKQGEQKSQRMISAEAKEAMYDKPVGKAEPFDKYEGLSDFERTLADICIGWIGEEPGWKQYIKDNSDVLLRVSTEKFNSVQDALSEQKPAWSEEDDDDAWMNDIISKVENNLQLNKAEIDWLKSLKERIQPKQEWNEEDERMFNYALDMIEWYSGKDEDKSRLVSDWLKSLKGRVQLQPKQEWSKEDQNALEDVREAVVNYWGGDTQDILLYWLKSLRQRIGGEQ